MARLNAPLAALLLALCAAAAVHAFVKEGCVPRKPLGVPAAKEAEGDWVVLMGFSVNNSVLSYCQDVVATVGSRPGLMRIHWLDSKYIEELPAWYVREKKILAVVICYPDAPPHLLLLGRRPMYSLRVAARIGRHMTGGRFKSGFLCTSTVTFSA